MRNRNLAVRRNVRNNIQALVENIIAKIAPVVKIALNETFSDNGYELSIETCNKLFNEYKWYVDSYEGKSYTELKNELGGIDFNQSLMDALFTVGRDMRRWI